MLATECEIFLTTLLKSLEGEMAPWLRSYTLEVLRSIVQDKDLLLFLYETYDAHPGSVTVYHDVVLILARIVQAGMAPQPDSGVDDILGAVSVLFRSKAKAGSVGRSVRLSSTSTYHVHVPRSRTTSIPFHACACIRSTERRLH